MSSVSILIFTTADIFLTFYLIYLYKTTHRDRTGGRVLISGRLKHRMCSIYVLAFHFSAFLKLLIYFSFFYFIGFIYYLTFLYIFFFHPACLCYISLNPRMLQIAFCFSLYKSCYFLFFTVLLNSLYSPSVPMGSFVITDLNSILRLLYCSNSVFYSYNWIRFV